MTTTTRCAEASLGSTVCCTPASPFFLLHLIDVVLSAVPLLLLHVAMPTLVERHDLKELPCHCFALSVPPYKCLMETSWTYAMGLGFLDVCNGARVLGFMH